MAGRKMMKLTAVTSILFLMGCAIFHFSYRSKPQVPKPAPISASIIAHEPVPFLALAEEKEPDPPPLPQIAPAQPNQSTPWPHMQSAIDNQMFSLCWFQCCKPESSIMQIELGGFESLKRKSKPVPEYSPHRIISPRPRLQRIDPDE
jgi:hypothetical protein